jgi:hypothetical protein
MQVDAVPGSLYIVERIWNELLASMLEIWDYWHTEPWRIKSALVSLCGRVDCVLGTAPTRYRARLVHGASLAEWYALLQ